MTDAKWPVIRGSVTHDTPLKGGCHVCHVHPRTMTVAAAHKCHDCHGLHAASPNPLAWNRNLPRGRDSPRKCHVPSRESRRPETVTKAVTSGWADPPIVPEGPASEGMDGLRPSPGPARWPREIVVRQTRLPGYWQRTA